MSRTTRDEYLEKMRCRYRRHTGKPAKHILINEFCLVTGHERKYATKLLAGRRGHSRGSGVAGPAASGGGRPRTYEAEVVGVLFENWRHSEQPCGKRLRPMLWQWLPFYERRYGALAERVREGVLSISAAQIDRVLAPRKVGAGVVNRRTPKANAAVKALVPIRAECWDAREPGWTEADTVAHCGGDMGGSFLNYHLHRHFTGRERPVAMTRSRPYHKNDQAHVEQKNSTHVRRLLGFERLGHDLLVELVGGLLEAWSIWRNAFTTTFKQTGRKRVGSKTVRRHEKVPRTPCERLVEHAEAGAATWRALRPCVRGGGSTTPSS